MMNPLTQPIAHPGEPPLILSDETEADLSTYLNLLIDQRWLIIGITLLVGLCGLLYALMASPVYEANMLVHVEEKGQREPKNILGEAGSMIDFKTPAAAEIELLRSITCACTFTPSRSACLFLVACWPDSIWRAAYPGCAGLAAMHGEKKQSLSRSFRYQSY
jgi:hypothetical protein